MHHFGGGRSAKNDTRVRKSENGRQRLDRHRRRRGYRSRLPEHLRRLGGRLDRIATGEVIRSRAVHWVGDHESGARKLIGAGTAFEKRRQLDEGLGRVMRVGEAERCLKAESPLVRTEMITGHYAIFDSQRRSVPVSRDDDSAGVAVLRAARSRLRAEARGSTSWKSPAAVRPVVPRGKSARLQAACLAADCRSAVRLPLLLYSPEQTCRGARLEQSRSFTPWKGWTRRTRRRRFITGETATYLSRRCISGSKSAVVLRPSCRAPSGTGASLPEKSGPSRPISPSIDWTNPPAACDAVGGAGCAWTVP